MKIHSFLALAILIFLPSCNTITNPEFLQEQAKLKTSAGPNSIVGTWVSKTFTDSAIEKSIMHKTMHIAEGGGGNMRITFRRPPTAPPRSEESTLSWQYVGNGEWQAQFANGRATMHSTGDRLLVESWFVVSTTESGYQLTSVVHREVYDRPNSRHLDQSIKRGEANNIDWIFAPKKASP